MTEASPIPVGHFHRLQNGRRIHYHETGRATPGRPTIVCLHGGGPGASGYSNFRRNIGYFAEHGFHALAPDLLGFGLSDKPDDIDYPSTLHVETIHDLVTAKGLDTVVPIGNSLGGSVALEYALTHQAQTAKLILMAPGGLADPKTFWGTTDGGTALATYARERPPGEAPFRKLLSLLVHDPATLTDEVVHERYGLAVQQPSRVFTSVSIQPTWERLGELKMPVLTFWGAHDRFLPVSQALIAANEIANSKVVISSGAGHWYMIEQADDFNREVVDFLDASNA